ncbi:hypothetical protein GCM10022419_099040 [Nonomuraea rosea]|uniref:Uncharacterized protein n=1 Tax=Nonomuraea rosea TaxID=638574 RepID=A0ABP6Z9J0_9ACTN
MTSGPGFAPEAPESVPPQAASVGSDTTTLARRAEIRRHPGFMCTVQGRGVKMAAII